MNIPEKVKIGALTYKVKQVKKINKIEDADTNTVGLWDPCETTIYVAKGVERQAKEHFFLHELFHALFSHCNIEQDEGKVDMLATALHMVIVDNPGIFD